MTNVQLVSSGFEQDCFTVVLKRGNEYLKCYQLIVWDPENFKQDYESLWEEWMDMKDFDPDDFTYWRQ